MKPTRQHYRLSSARLRHAFARVRLASATVASMIFGTCPKTGTIVNLVYLALRAFTRGSAHSNAVTKHLLLYKGSARVKHSADLLTPILTATAMGRIKP